MCRGARARDLALYYNCFDMTPEEYREEYLKAVDQLLVGNHQDALTRYQKLADDDATPDWIRIASYADMAGSYIALQQTDAALDVFEKSAQVLCRSFNETDACHNCYQRIGYQFSFLIK